MSQVEVKKSQDWHESVIDMMLKHPGITKSDIARRMNKSLTWISIITNTDAFLQRLAERREELNSTLAATIAEKMGDVADAGLDELGRRLVTQGTTMETDDVVKITTGMLKHLGYGAPKGTGLSVVGDNNQVLVVDKDNLAAARARIGQRGALTPGDSQLPPGPGGSAVAPRVEQGEQEMLPAPTVPPLDIDTGETVAAGYSDTDEEYTTDDDITAEYYQSDDLSAAE
jgi:hypothetical protein